MKLRKSAGAGPRPHLVGHFGDPSPGLTGHELDMAAIEERGGQDQLNLLILHLFDQFGQVLGGGGDPGYGLHKTHFLDPKAAAEIGPDVVVRHRLGAEIRLHLTQPAAQEGFVMLRFQEVQELAVFV